MPKVSSYTRNRIESLHGQNLQPAEIFKLLEKEDLAVSFATVPRIIKKLKLMGTTNKGKSTGRPKKLNAEARTFIEDQMRKDDETTSCQIQKKLENVVSKCIHQQSVDPESSRDGLFNVPDIVS